jgi:hypothetical protein
MESFSVFSLTVVVKRYNKESYNSSRLVGRRGEERIEIAMSMMMERIT